MTGEVSLLAALLVAVGGGTGSWIRWRVTAAIASRSHSDLLAGLLVINTVGSLALGVLYGLTNNWWVIALLGTGLCGGFTTFSSASVDALQTLRRGAVMPGLVSVIGMALLAVAAFAIGHWAVTW